MNLISNTRYSLQIVADNKNNQLGKVCEELKDKVEKAGFFIGSLIVLTKSETIKQSDYIVVNKASNSEVEVQIQILDKGYVTEKEFKKLSKTFKNIETYLFFQSKR
mgnify:CR=1 FL=1